MNDADSDEENRSIPSPGVMEADTATDSSHIMPVDLFNAEEEQEQMDVSMLSDVVPVAVGQVNVHHIPENWVLLNDSSRRFRVARNSERYENNRNWIIWRKNGTVLLIDRSFLWTIDWLFDCLFDPSVNQLIDWSIDWLIDFPFSGWRAAAISWTVAFRQTDSIVVHFIVQWISLEGTLSGYPSGRGTGPNVSVWRAEEVLGGRGSTVWFDVRRGRRFSRGELSGNRGAVQSHGAREDERARDGGIWRHCQPGRRSGMAFSFVDWWVDRLIDWLIWLFTINTM